MTQPDENDRLRAAVVEGDRIIERLRERIHPTMDGYCPECGGGCLIGFATPTPARDAVLSRADDFGPGLREAQRRLSAAGMHDAACSEKPCTCGIDDAVLGLSQTTRGARNHD